MLRISGSSPGMFGTDVAHQVPGISPPVLRSTITEHIFGGVWACLGVNYRRRGVIHLTPAVVAHDYACHAGINRSFGIVGTHHAFHQHGYRGELDEPAQVLPVE